MPANPNTAFSDGTPFTANQANRFGRGVVGDASSTSTYTLTGTLADITGMTVTFTAEAGRLYRATYFCGSALNGTEGTTRMRLDFDLSGTTVGRMYLGALTQSLTVNAAALFTTTAGSKTLKVRALFDIGVANTLYADATTPMRLWVEDLGPY